MFNLISITYAAVGGFISGLGVSFAVVFFKYTKYRREMEQLIKKGWNDSHAADDTPVLQKVDVIADRCDGEMTDPEDFECLNFSYRSPYDDLRETVAMCKTLAPSDVVDCSMAAANKLINEMVDSFYTVAKEYMDETTVNTIISEVVNRVVYDDIKE